MKIIIFFFLQLGTNVAYNGVGPWRAGEDEIDVKLYYQWVPFVLFLQALMFYIPHIIFKLMERDKVVGVIAGLHNWILDDEERGTKETELAKYIVETRGTHWGMSKIPSKIVSSVLKSQILPTFSNYWEFL